MSKSEPLLRVEKLTIRFRGLTAVNRQTGAPIWHIGTHGNPGAYLVLQDDGNLVVYEGDAALWNTGPA